ncbi:cytoskeletal protein CcmA (bactofilin family) [Catalinimonas alkaloidigena]|uniref:bactofilin family protein n=1 Tax=Catalinimonas alkaloidigena TaxID=1075417 RepID=UPI002405C0C7|nr:polymer-forming cytoskeletal protein [Catalinimonas alkaloidigena]MDF9798302.1 cytoskeletal protein CcmA (bactofilin family) [Catalinimonas alkaloidigena]
MTMFSNNQKEKVKTEEASNSSSIIGKGTSVQGDLNTVGNMRIEGDVKGNVTCKSKIALGQSSYVEGTVLAQNAEIAGEIQGSIEISELLILRPTAVIHGDIVTNKLIVESGATFNGSCRMGVSVNDINFDDEPDEFQPEDEPEEDIKSSSKEKESRSI